MHHKPVGVIKGTAEHFIVQELVHTRSGIHVVPLEKSTAVNGYDGAPVTTFELTKVGYTTHAAIQEIARQLHVHLGDVSVHGQKDRHACTAQQVGVAGTFAPGFEHRVLWLRQVGESDSPLRIGGNAGNRFRIVVATDAQNIRLDAMEEFPNYFGHQRTESRDHCEVGRLLFEGRFKKATRKMQELSGDMRLLEAALRETGTWKGAWLHPTLRFDFEFKLQKWQSYLWNQLVREKLGNGLATHLPVWSPEHAHHYTHLWDPEELSEESLSRVKGFVRPTRVRPKNLKAEKVPEGWRLSFDLRQGSYATTALSQLFQLKW